MRKIGRPPPGVGKTTRRGLAEPSVSKRAAVLPGRRLRPQIVALKVTFLVTVPSLLSQNELSSLCHFGHMQKYTNMQWIVNNSVLYVDLNDEFMIAQRDEEGISAGK